MIPNFRLTRQDIIFTEDICGPNRGSFERKDDKSAHSACTHNMGKNVPKDKIPFTVTTSRNIYWNC